MTKSAPARVSARPPADEVSTRQFAEDVAVYLARTPRQLPSRYLYDALGSALFDAICHLPWYHITRAERSLLERHAGDVLSAASPFSHIVELGPGTGGKLAALLSARSVDAAPVAVHLVDVSRAALERAARLLSGLEGVGVVLHQATYEVGIADVVGDQPGGGRTLVLFLGSNIGNFDPPGSSALLRRLHEALRPGDLLLLGTDLVKPEAELLVAYDDPLQVTAAFNRNLLVRINRELGGDFDLASFRHRAVWNPDASRIEMHLVSARPQRVRVRAAGLAIAMRESEIIWTESSYKYTVDGVSTMLADAGFVQRQAWVEPSARFALTLAERRGDVAPTVSRRAARPGPTGRT